MAVQNWSAGDANRLSAAQIMDMVQNGYNSLNPRDVQNYMSGKKPLYEENIGFFFGSEGLKKNLGEGHMNDNSDYGTLKNSFGSDPGADFQYEEDQYTTTQDYKRLGSGGFKDISSKVKARVESRQQFQEYNQQNSNKKLQNIFEDEEDERPILKKRPQQSNKITDKKKAGQIGYNIGVEYINEFIELLKNPNSKQRYLLFERIQEVIEKEGLFTDEACKYYKGGINKAEKEMMDKIKKKRNG